jgi:hypothetical protein
VLRILPTSRLERAHSRCYDCSQQPYLHGYRHEPLLRYARVPCRPVLVHEILRDDPHSVSPIARGEAFVARLKDSVEMAQALVAHVQDKYERYTNLRSQLAQQFRVGDKVWLSMRNITTLRPHRKLDWLYHKFTVTALIGSHAVRLDTPPGVTSQRFSCYAAETLCQYSASFSNPG